MAGKRKSTQVEEVIREFRVSGNLDDAFDNLAAERLGVSETDLHCLNIIENAGGVTAGELAAQSGLTTGAVTGVIDRLAKKGFARRVPDPSDRRRVKVEVTRAFYSRAERIWGPVAAEWASALGGFTGEQLEILHRFLRETNEITRAQLDRLREMR
jgi:DNA-binding MarR family transcriptional regulator